MGMVGGSRVGSSDQPATWRMPCPPILGALTAMLGHDRLVISNLADPSVLLQPTGRASGACISARIDLAAACRTYLPMCLPLLPSGGVILSGSPLYAFGESVVAAEDHGLMRGPGQRGRLTLAGDVVAPLAGLAVLEQARALMDAADPIAAADRIFSCYGSPSQPRLVTLFRMRSGWQVLEQVPVAAWPQPALDRAGLDRRLLGLKHLCGPEPEQLPVVAWEVQPMLDRHWLPATEVLAEHLAPYALDLVIARAGAGQSLLLHETGVPLVSTLGLTNLNVGLPARLIAAF